MTTHHHHASSPSNPTGHAAGLIRLRLAEEDLWLIDMLAEHQVLTAGQATQLGYQHTAARTRRRLQALAAQQLLAPFTLTPPAGRPLRCWSIGPVGAVIAAYRHGGPRPRPATTQARLHRLATNPHTAALFAANGFFTSLAAHVRARPGQDLRLWWSPRTCRSVTTGVPVNARHGGYFYRGRWVGFWLEYDPAPRSPARLRTHLRRYQRLGQATGVSTLLWWTPHPDREQRLLHQLRDHSIDGLTIAVSGPHHGNPAEPVWQVASGGKPVALAALPESNRIDHPHADVRADIGQAPPVTPLPPHPIWDPDRGGDEAIIDQWTYDHHTSRLG